MDEKKNNQWKIALLDRLRRGDITFDDDISPDDALELFCKSIVKGLQARFREQDDITAARAFPTGVLILNDMNGIKIEGGSSELHNDDEPTPYPVLILSRTPHTDDDSLYIVLKDPRALRNFHIALADAAMAIMHPETAVAVSDSKPSNEQTSITAQRLLDVLNSLSQPPAEN